MDTGRGNFAELSEDKAKELIDKGLEVFRVGEFVHLKGSKFEIKEIGFNELRLNLVAKFQG